MKKENIGKLFLLVCLSLFASLADARGSRVNSNSAIEDYLEFHGHKSDFAMEEHVQQPQTKARKPVTHPKLKQEDTYDGYQVDQEAFSNTDAYQYALQFKIGAKLDENYLYVDECFDGWVHLFDDVAFYQNNVTAVQKAIDNEIETNWWFNYLNLTGIMFGPISEIIVECYRFGNSVYKYEAERLIQFGNEAGEFFLAFLFNQMGNALYFQAKFERIQNYEEKQNYQSIWLEYGDLFYLIWDFDPLPAASYDAIETYLTDWVETHVVDENNDMHRVMAASGVPIAAKMIKDLSVKVDQTISETSQIVSDYFADLKASHSKVLADMAATRLETYDWATTAAEWGVAPFVVSTDLLDVLYGVVNGAVDVFPYRSNPQRCFRNATQAYTVVDNWLPANWNLDIVNDEDDRLVFFKEISYLVGTPFGVCYSCYWAGVQVFAESEPSDPDNLTEAEALTELLTIGHEIPTNLLFNMGYMYGDIWSLYTLSQYDGKYWERFGRYIGDFVIRIFWRREFTRNFTYDQDFDEDDNDD